MPPRLLRFTCLRRLLLRVDTFVLLTSCRFYAATPAAIIVTAVLIDTLFAALR